MPSGRRHQRCLESTARHGRTGGSVNKGKKGGGAEDQVPASANQRGRRAGTRTDVNMHKMPEPADRHVCRHARMRGCAGQRTKPRTCDCALRAGKRMSRERTQAGLARADTQMCTHVHGSARARVLGHSRGARARAGGGALAAAGGGRPLVGLGRGAGRAARPAGLRARLAVRRGRGRRVGPRFLPRGRSPSVAPVGVQPSR